MRKAVTLSIALMFSSWIDSAQTNPVRPGGPPPLLLGTAWYPEQWAEQKCAGDLTLMEGAGILMVSFGEFACALMDPAEVKYDLDWLYCAVNDASRCGIYTVMGTPSA